MQDMRIYSPRTLFQIFCTDLPTLSNFA